MFVRDVTAAGPQPTAAPRFGRQGRPPLSVTLETNQVLNRVVMDIFGWGGPGVVFARNTYERIEKALDIGSWLVAGVAFPLILDRAVNRVYTKYLRRQFPQAFLTKKIMPLAVPFEWLFRAEHARNFGPGGKLLPELAQYGLKSFPKSLARKVFLSKVLMILLPDMLLMAAKGQGYYWGKNRLTEILTRRKGFVGEMSYTEDAYLRQKAAQFEKNKWKRITASLIIGFGSALTLPLLMYLAIRSPKKTGEGIMGTLKRFVPAFNYSNAIYMSKWVLMWHTFFNWNVASMLSSRDREELREKAITTSVILAIYSIGDDIIGGLLARALDRYARRKYQTPILSAEKGLFHMPKLMPLETLLKKYGKKSQAYKLGLVNFWLGVVGVCVGINSALPILNNLYTRQKVVRDQARWKQKRLEALNQRTFSPKPLKVMRPLVLTHPRVFPPQPLKIMTPVPQAMPVWPTGRFLDFRG